MIEGRWYLCELNGKTPVYLWGPQIEFFKLFYRVTIL